ncbi:hypothetical protein GWI33_013448 [Rhynchophorus ferrugineus]|uniref:Uncharacterized protein n=1 Tax=Rhynchophorus ferrugineus TaxID=354439 RepID=A0A834I3D0_RHYFE|nr:hypothetical protein GWI33_013448 [Rhynchophorus ferrugineus]
MRHITHVLYFLFIYLLQCGFVRLESDGMEYPFIVKIYKYDTSEYGDLLWSNLKGVIIDKSLIITSASLLQK